MLQDDKHISYYFAGEYKECGEVHVRVQNHWEIKVYPTDEFSYDVSTYTKLFDFDVIK